MNSTVKVPANNVFFENISYVWGLEILCDSFLLHSIQIRCWLNAVNCPTNYQGSKYTFPEKTKLQRRKRNQQSCKHKYKNQYRAGRWLQEKTALSDYF